MTMDKNMKLAQKETVVMCHNTVQSMHKNNAFIFLGKHHPVFHPVRCHDPSVNRRRVTMFVFWWGTLSLWPHLTSSEVRWRCVCERVSEWVTDGRVATDGEFWYSSTPVWHPTADTGKWTDITIHSSSIELAKLLWKYAVGRELISLTCHILLPDCSVHFRFSLQGEPSHNLHVWWRQWGKISHHYSPYLALKESKTEIISETENNYSLADC